MARLIIILEFLLLAGLMSFLWVFGLGRLDDERLWVAAIGGVSVGFATWAMFWMVPRLFRKIAQNQQRARGERASRQIDEFGYREGLTAAETEALKANLTKKETS